MKKIILYSLLVAFFVQVQTVFAVNNTCVCVLTWEGTQASVCIGQTVLYPYSEAKTRAAVFSSINVPARCNGYAGSAPAIADITVINSDINCTWTKDDVDIQAVKTADGSTVTLEPKLVCAPKESTVNTSPAQSTFQPPSSTPLVNPLTGTTNAQDIPAFVGGIIQRLLGILGSVSLVVFMYGAFKWITSEGESDDIAEGTHTMAYAAIGILVIFASYGILQSVIGGITGG